MSSSRSNKVSNSAFKLTTPASKYYSQTQAVSLLAVLPSYRQRDAKSLSISSMLELGKVISKTLDAPESVECFEFSIESMAWNLPFTLPLYIEKTSFEKGGFREVHMAKDVSDKNYVVKKLLKESLERMKVVNNSVERKESAASLCRKAVQMHKLAANFAMQMKKSICSKGFGQTFSYQDAKFGILSCGEPVVIEDFIPGAFQKYINNDGFATLVEGKEGKFCKLVEKAEALSHFTYQKSEKKLILLDIQGTGYNLYDPEIATSTGFSDDEELQFCMGTCQHLHVTIFRRHTSATDFVK